MKIKTMIIVALTMLTTLNVVAQEDEGQRTLFGGNSDHYVDVGFAGTVRLGGGSLSDRGAFCLGADLGVILGHCVELGAFADGFLTEEFSDYNIDGDRYFFDGAVGGLYVKPIFMHNSPVHISIPIRFGVGEIEYTSDNYEDYYYNHRHHHYGHPKFEDDCTVFTIEPGVMIEFNIVRNFHISAGVSYKMINGLDLKYRDNSTDIIKSKGLNGTYYTINCSFGIF